MAELIGGPVAPTDEAALNATPFVRQGDFAIPVDICEGKPRVLSMYAEPDPAAGERLLACSVALAYGWHAYMAAGAALRPGYLTAEKAVYAYAVTTLGAEARSAIDAMLTEMGTGPIDLPNPVAGLRAPASLATAKASPKATPAALHAAFQAAIAPWVARLVAHGHLGSTALLDPTGPAVEGKDLAGDVGNVRLAMYFDVVGGPSPAISMGAGAAWKIYAMTGDPAFYAYVTDLIAVGAAQTIAANKKSGATGWTLADVKAQILWELTADLP